MSSNKQRVSRDLSTRDKDTRVKNWVKPTLLPDPDAEAGYTYRWVRISNNGVVDPTNVSSKIREGWQPVLAKDHPEIVLVETESERFQDNVVMGGLMLCKMPTDMVNQRNAFYESQTKGQMDSVDNNLMRESDARMPLFNDRKSKVSFGDGK